MHYRKIAMLCGIALVLAGCSSRTEREASNELITQVDTRLNSAAMGQGNGFICTGTDKAWGCICKKGAASDDPLNCDGMEKLCKVLGTPQTCKPDGVCRCTGVYTIN
jgi:hypothetical protein